MFKITVLAVSLNLGFSSLAFADLAGGDAGLSQGYGQLSDQVQQQSSDAQADIVVQQQICSNDPDSSDCAAAQTRIAQDQAQIQSNSTLNKQLDSTFNQVSDQQAINQRVQVASLKQCLYSLAVACSILSGGGDLTQTSLSGKTIKDEQVAPMPEAPVAASGPN